MKFFDGSQLFFLISLCSHLFSSSLQASSTSSTRALLASSQDSVEAYLAEGIQQSRNAEFVLSHEELAALDASIALELMQKETSSEAASSTSVTSLVRRVAPIHRVTSSQDDESPVSETLAHKTGLEFLQFCLEHNRTGLINSDGFDDLMMFAAQAQSESTPSLLVVAPQLSMGVDFVNLLCTKLPLSTKIWDFEFDMNSDQISSRIQHFVQEQEGGTHPRSLGRHALLIPLCWPNAELPTNEAIARKQEIVRQTLWSLFQAKDRKKVLLCYVIAQDDPVFIELIRNISDLRNSNIIQGHKLVVVLQNQNESQCSVAQTVSDRPGNALPGRVVSFANDINSAIAAGKNFKKLLIVASSWQLGQSITEQISQLTRIPIKRWAWDFSLDRELLNATIESYLVLLKHDSSFNSAIGKVIIEIQLQYTSPLSDTSSQEEKQAKREKATEQLLEIISSSAGTKATMCFIIRENDQFYSDLVLRASSGPVELIRINSQQRPKTGNAEGAATCSSSSSDSTSSERTTRTRFPQQKIEDCTICMESKSDMCTPCCFQRVICMVCWQDSINATKRCPFCRKSQ